MYMLELNCDIAYGMSALAFYAMFSAQYMYLRKHQDFKAQSLLLNQISLNVLGFMYSYWYVADTKGLSQEQKR